MSVEEEISSGAESIQFPVGGDRAGLGWPGGGAGDTCFAPCSVPHL